MRSEYYTAMSALHQFQVQCSRSVLPNFATGPVCAISVAGQITWSVRVHAWRCCQTLWHSTAVCWQCCGLPSRCVVTANKCSHVHVNTGRYVDKLNTAAVLHC